ATEASILASESHIELSHTLDNNPRVGYAHQTNLIGPDYTLLTFLSNVLGQYNSWYTANTPYVVTTDAGDANATSQATVIADQAAWSTARQANSVTSSLTGSQLTVTNTSGGTLTVPVNAPIGSTVVSGGGLTAGSAFGSEYGGTLSAWVNIPAGQSLVLNVPLNPTITSTNTASTRTGVPFSFTVTTSELSSAPVASLTETGDLPPGITFTDNHNGTATLAGTVPAHTIATTYSFTIGASNGDPPDASQTFNLVVTQPEQYDMVGSDGGVFVFGQAGGFFGSLPGLGVRVNNIKGIVPTADEKGYFLVGSDGGVFAFGDAPFENSLPGIGVHVNNIVGIVPTPDDRGYFLVGSDGGVFAFGDAGFENSLPGLGVHVSNIAGIAINGTTGYWLVGADGAIYALGSAQYLGGLGGASPTPIVGIATARGDTGYWLDGRNGSVYSYGTAKFYGSLPALGIAVNNVVGIVPTPDQLGYWLVGSDGGIFAFGDSQEVGSLPGLGIHVSNVVGAVPTS
ncbi:MAG TPA: hypothetical protein VGL60_00640, partial [Acidimicrobiales bacterium]